MTAQIAINKKRSPKGISSSQGAFFISSGLSSTKWQLESNLARLQQGRAVRLDVRAKDPSGTVYDIEIQQADKRAGARRARYNTALMDSDETVTGIDTEKLPETYVIFITENDVLGGNLPLYHIDRTVKELAYKNFNDGAHIIYVNGKYRGENPIGDLMHDFSCKNADDMKSTVLAEKLRHLKENEKGVKICVKL